MHTHKKKYASWVEAASQGECFSSAPQSCSVRKVPLSSLPGIIRFPGETTQPGLVNDKGFASSFLIRMEIGVEGFCRFGGAFGLLFEI